MFFNFLIGLEIINYPPRGEPCEARIGQRGVKLALASLGGMGGNAPARVRKKRALIRCRRRELNLRPTDYESVALPLSYVG